ncbi:MAG: SGNH/GDSL hydrolase family protein [Planctomycetota bacterium]
MKTVILIGDSIRLGYQPVVAEELGNRARVCGPEANGGDTRNLLEHLEEWVMGAGADVVHVNAGLHDIRRPFGAKEPTVPLEEYRCNVDLILRRITEQAGADAAWATTTPVNQRRHHQRKSFDRFEEDVLTYNRVALEVCQELGVPVDNLFEVVMDAGRDRLLAEDGVHFTEEGYRLLGRAVADAVRKCCLMGEEGTDA